MHPRAWFLYVGFAPVHVWQLLPRLRYLPNPIHFKNMMLFANWEKPTQISLYWTSFGKVSLAHSCPRWFELPRSEIGGYRFVRLDFVF